MTPATAEDYAAVLQGVLALLVCAAIAIWVQASNRDAQQDRAESAEARIEQLEIQLEAARDSVLVGEIEGFNLRCYAVRTESR